MKQINPERTVTALALLLAAFLGLGLFSQAVHNNSHNEQMYVTAGYLLAQGERLYTDFAFVQTPYSPLIYAAVFRLTGGYYLSAKLVNLAFLAFAADCFASARRRTHDDQRRTAGALFLANYYLLRAAIEASNYTMPIAFSAMAYALFLRYTGLLRRPLAFFAAGAAGQANGAKSLRNPAGALRPGCAALSRRASLPQPHHRRSLPAGGTVAGAVPALLRRDWERFAFNNLGYHLLNTTWREQSGFVPMTWEPCWAQPAYPRQPQLPAAGRSSGAGSRHLLHTGRLLPAPSAPARGGHHPSALLVVVSIVTAFTPQPLFPQYFAMLKLSCSRCCSRRVHTAQPQRVMLQHLTLIAAVLLTPSYCRGIPAAPRGAPSPMTAGPAVRRDGKPASAPASPKVRTTWPLPSSPLSPQSMPSSPAWASIPKPTGSFVLRIGDLLSEEQRFGYRATSPAAIAALFDADLPAAILITDEGAVELPLPDYAQSRGYVEVDAEGFGGRLYIKPNP